MKDWAEFIKGIAALMWPVLSFVVLLLYRRQFQMILDRFRRGKFLGQELELEAMASDAKQRPLASAVAIESLDALLASPEFHKKISAIVDSSLAGGKEEATKNVVQALKTAAASGVANAFIKVDTRPFLGRFGKIWEEPYEDSLTVRKFLDRIWLEMNPHTYPYDYRVQAYRYPEGWVLRDPSTGRLFTDIGRKSARQRGQAEDERLLTDVALYPGSAVEVVAGPKADEALRLP